MSEGDQPESQRAAAAGGSLRHGPAPRSLRLEGLVMLDTAAAEPVAIEAMFFADDGIGVIHNRGDRPRVLPWSALSAHAVEKWAGGEIPAGWLLPVPEEPGREPWVVPTPPTPPRVLPRVEPGALIGIQTSFGTYRFVCPGTDPSEVSLHVTAFAVRHQGPEAASSVTRVVAWGHDVERRRTERRPPRPVGWTRVQPYLVVGLVVLLAAVVTLILLQSSGAIHLPLLGGTGGSGTGTVGSLGPLTPPGRLGASGPVWLGVPAAA